MSKFRVDRQDESRVLLTEVLPYETPLFFSNALLYKLDKAMRKQTAREPALVRSLVGTKLDSLVPYEFSILHSAGKLRVLSLIHPAAQRMFVDFYSQNADAILYLCSKSSFSLRSPVRVASQYVEKSLWDREESEARDLGPEEERDAFELQTRYASSFFEYRQYGYLYKFYQSNELLRLEKRFRFLLQFDIARCFSSVYTHSVTWAAKGKDFAKVNRKAYTVESQFDKLMQKSNYDETHGIVIGPEASRIFAEIILQRVDLDVQLVLEKQECRFKVDYQVRRYIDDYFVFARNEKIAKKVFLEFQTALQHYKLFVNESKTREQRTPLMSAQSLAKIRAGRVLDAFFEQSVDLHPSGPEPRLFRNRGGRPAWVRVVDDLKVVEKETGSGYEGLVGYCLGTLRSQCAKVFSAGNRTLLKEQQKRASEFAVSTLEIAFFLYAMDMRVRPTYLLIQIVTIVDRVAGMLESEFAETIRKRSLDELVEAVDRIKANGEESGVEMANLLIALRTLGGTYEMPQRRLAECFQIGWEQGTAAVSPGKFVHFNQIGYFESVTLLYYMESRTQYNLLRTSLLAHLRSRFEEAEAPHRSAEFTLLFCDLLSCPYVDEALKKRLTEVMSSAAGTLSELSRPGESERIINYCRDYIHWVDWGGGLELVNLLEKKELRTPYGEW
jgi:hypothetical protein